MNHPTKLAMFLVAFGFVTVPTRAGEAVTWAAASESDFREDANQFDLVFVGQLLDRRQQLRQCHTWPHGH